MRNELLHAYVIHHRKYRDKSYIIHILSHEYGRVDGIIRQPPPPQYQPIQLYATGRHELKNFNHIDNSQPPIFLTGDSFFLGFYLNELLLRLAPIEQEMSATFVQYEVAIKSLQSLSSHLSIEVSQQLILQTLRQFEHVFLQDLGYLPDFFYDSNQKYIQSEQLYDYDLNQGFVHTSKGIYHGRMVLEMQQYQEGDFNPIQLQGVTQLYRHILQQLLGNKSLKSRQLWIQHKYK